MVSSLTFLACSKIQHFQWNALKILKFMSVACGLPLLILRVAIRVIHWFNGTFGHYGPLGMPEGVWPSLSQCGLFFVQTTIPTPSMHQNLPNTQSVLCKTTISWPKLLQNYRITLITFVHCHIKCDIGADLLLCDETEGAVAGATAGVVVEAALYPIDTIKTRLQVSSFWHQFQ